MSRRTSSLSEVSQSPALVNPRDRASERLYLETLEGAGVLSPSVNFGSRKFGLNFDEETASLSGLQVDISRQLRGLQSDSPLPSPSTLSNVSISNHFNGDEIEDEPVVFVEQPNSSLFCLLCNRVFRDPVIVSCGHTFCKRCVIFQDSINCPVDKIKISVVVANLAVAEQIGELLVHCRYGLEPTIPSPVSNHGQQATHQCNPNGCPTTIRLNMKRVHEKDCDFKPVRCPNNPDCPIMIQKDLADHLSKCQHALCPRHQYGPSLIEARKFNSHCRNSCSFHGTASELEVHLSGCQYEAMKDYIHHTESRMTELQQMLQQKDQEIGFLRSMLGKLSEKVDSLEKSVEDYIENRLESMCSEISTLHDKFQVILSSQSSAYDPQQIFKCKGTFVGHGGPVWCLCVHQDYLFSGSSDKTIKVWDTAYSYKCLKTLEGHQGIVLALAVNGNKLYSGSQDCYVLVWNIETFEVEKAMKVNENPIGTLVAAKGMLFGGSLRLIKVWDIHTMQVKRNITGLNHWVRALATSQNYLYGGSYQTIKIWDLDTLECVRQLETPGGSVYSIAITTHHILCGTYENCIHVWELNSYNQVSTLVGHLGTVYALAVLNSPSGTRVFSASYDHSLRVWSMDNLICTQTLVRHEGSVACLAVSRGQIFSGALDGTVKVWR